MKWETASEGISHILPNSQAFPSQNNLLQPGGKANDKQHFMYTHSYIYGDVKLESVVEDLLQSSLTTTP